MLEAFFDVDRISLRQIQQALNRFQVVLVLAQDDIAKFPNYAVEFCTALILRAYDPDILDKLLRGELSDEDVVKHSLPPMVREDAELIESRLNFEMAVIRAHQEIVGLNQSTGKYDQTPLLRSYKKLLESTSGDFHANLESRFARELVALVDRLADPKFSIGSSTGVPHRFKLAVSQLEMMEQLKTTKYS